MSTTPDPWELEAIVDEAFWLWWDELVYGPIPVESAEAKETLDEM